MSAFERLGLNPLSTKPIETRLSSKNQEQTKVAFAYKWSNRASYESDAMVNACKKWLFEQYCNDDPRQLSQWLEGGRKIILDAGCGSGFGAVLFFGEHLKNHDYLGIDISDAVEIAKKRFKELHYPGDFLQSDLLELPIKDGSIDVIFANGVLHHTDNTEKSIKALSRKLKTGGLFLFYLYAKKAVVREFTDDYIREKLSNLSNQAAWEALKPLTKLGQALGELKVDLEVPEDIPFLGIKKGKLDLQRFIYWNFCKLYYRPEFTLEEMNHANFDWFRPANCWRHTKEEVILYCKKANLDIEHLYVQNSGISVVARKT